MRPHIDHASSSAAGPARPAGPQFVGWRRLSPVLETAPRPPGPRFLGRDVHWGGAFFNLQPPLAPRDGRRRSTADGSRRLRPKGGIAGLLLVERAACPRVRGACRRGNGVGRGGEGGGRVPSLARHHTLSGGHRVHHDDDDEKRRRCRSRPDACVRMGVAAPTGSTEGVSLGRWRGRVRARQILPPDLGGDSFFHLSHEATHITHTHAPTDSA